MHFRLTHEHKPELEKSLKSNRRIETIHYDPVDREHSGLTSAIASLNEALTDRKQELLETGNW